MNPVERTLNDDLTSLIERLAGALPAGSLEAVRAGSPTLSARLDETEAKVAALRLSLLDGYGRWNRALEDLENLWALAAWRSAAAEDAPEKAGSLAA